MAPGKLICKLLYLGSAHHSTVRKAVMGGLDLSSILVGITVYESEQGAIIIGKWVQEGLAS